MPVRVIVSCGLCAAPVSCGLCAAPAGLCLTSVRRRGRSAAGPAGRDACHACAQRWVTGALWLPGPRWRSGHTAGRTYVSPPRPCPTLLHAGLSPWVIPLGYPPRSAHTSHFRAGGGVFRFGAWRMIRFTHNHVLQGRWWSGPFLLVPRR